MVRFIVGSLVSVGQGKLSKDDVALALLSGAFECKPECAPAQGLSLTDVNYEHKFEWVDSKPVKI